MNIKKILLAGFFLLPVIDAYSQIPSGRRVDWTHAGVNWGEVGYNVGDAAATFDAWYDVTSNPFANLDKTGVTDCGTALNTIIAGLTPGQFVLLYFPEGTYKFVNKITITRSNLVLRGANPAYTTIKCNGLEVVGSIPHATYLVNAKTTNTITTSTTNSFALGDYVELIKPQDLVTNCNYSAADPTCSTKVSNEYGQISKVIFKTGNTVTLEDVLLNTYTIAPSPNEVKVREVTAPVRNFGIEDMHFYPENATVSRARISYRYVINSWITGVEAEYCSDTADMISISKCAKVTVSGCHIHHGASYGSNNYGIWIGEKSTNCLVENNVLNNLRHHIVLSTSMPSQNVIGYNLTYKSEVNQDEISLHGFYPSYNLFEGNVTGYFGSDIYWGLNGPFNSVFRSRTETVDYQYSQSRNYCGNIYTTFNYVGSVDPFDDKNNSSTVIADKSYYLLSKPAFLPARFSWPPIGNPSTSGQIISNTIPAEERFESGGQFTINPRDEFTGYSIENIGLLTGLNAISANPAVIYRNDGDLSIGHTKLYENTGGYWDVAAITSAIINSSGKEEILMAFNNTAGGYGIYRTTDKTDPQVSLLSGTGVVLSMVAGDFDGDGIDEFFTAIREGFVTKLYKSNTMTNLKQTLFHTTANFHSISCLAAGNTDVSDAGDELFIGFNGGSNTYVYRNDNASTWASNVTIYSNTTNTWDIAALTCGDFDADGDDELVEGFNPTSGGPAIYRSEDGDATVVNIYSGPSTFKVAALAAGDLDLDGDEELVTGFNSTIQGPAIYKSEDASPAEEVCLYSRPDVYWNLKALAIEKDFTKSMKLPGENTETTGEWINAKNVLVYPNPNKGQFTVQLTEELKDGARYKVFNMQGQEIMAADIKALEWEINLGENNHGIFVVQVENGESFKRIKVVVQE